jgi:hypothetical protein
MSANVIDIGGVQTFDKKCGYVTQQSDEAADLAIGRFSSIGSSGLGRIATPPALKCCAIRP